MDQTFRFLVISAVTYMAFLGVVRIVLASQYRARSFLINIIGMITVYGSFLMGHYADSMKLPEYILYTVPILLIVLLPPLSLKMKTGQTLKYLILSIIGIVLIHTCFSLFLGWRDLLPFMRIPPIWDIL